MDLLYWFSIPFVNAFNASQVLIDPLIIALAAASLYALQGKLDAFKFGRLDGLLALFLGSVALSTCVNANTIEAKSINHLIAVFASFSIFYYLAVRISRELTIERILAVLWAGYIFTTVFGLVEFSLVNFLGIDLGSIVPRPSVSEYHPGFLDIVLIRSRSLFEESGYYAAYLSTVAPLLVHYLWRVNPSRAGKTAFILLSASSYFVAFSVSLFIFLPFAALLPSMVRLVAERRLARRLVWLYVIVLAAALVVMSSDTLMNALFLRKFSGNSFEDRNDKFEATLELMSNASWSSALFGYGPGSYFQLDVPPAISVYLNFWRDFGLLGIAAYFTFVIGFLRRCYADRSPLGLSIFVSALVVQLFYVATPAYFLPGYLLPLVLYKINSTRERRLRAASMADPARLAGRAA